MDSKVFLEILKRIEQQFGAFGPMVAALVASLIRQSTTITYTEEQKQSFVENELKALAYRADDVRRSHALDGGPQ